MERDVNIVIREVETVYILLSYNTVDWWPQWRKNPLAWISAVIWWSDCKYCWWRHDFIRGNRLPWHFYGEFEITIIHMPIICGVFFLRKKSSFFISKEFVRIFSGYTKPWQENITFLLSVDLFKRVLIWKHKHSECNFLRA